MVGVICGALAPLLESVGIVRLSRCNNKLNRCRGCFSTPDDTSSIMQASKAPSAEGVARQALIQIWRSFEATNFLETTGVLRSFILRSNEAAKPYIPTLCHLIPDASSLRQSGLCVQIERDEHQLAEGKTMRAPRLAFSSLGLTLYSMRI